MRILPLVVIVSAFLLILLAAHYARRRTPRPIRVAAAHTLKAPPPPEPATPEVEFPYDEPVRRVVPQPPPPALLAQRPRAKAQMEEYRGQSSLPQGHYVGTNCAQCHVAQD